MDTPVHDAGCKNRRCTLFCEARHAYAAALAAFRAAKGHGDLSLICETHERLTLARSTAVGLHLFPVGSGLAEKE